MMEIAFFYITKAGIGSNESKGEWKRKRLAMCRINHMQRNRGYVTKGITLFYITNETSAFHARRSAVFMP